jgi:hypothetical protein
VYRTVTQPQPTFYAADGGGFAHAFGTTNLTNLRWYYVAGTYDATAGAAAVYLDGSENGTATMTGPIQYLDKPVDIGCTPQPDSWNGLVDEVRISPTVHSAGWIATEFANQSDPSTFVSVGATERR